MDDLQRFLERLASAAPTPGGGSAAALAAAAAAALLAMVTRLAAKRHPSRRDTVDRLLPSAESLLDAMCAAARDDALAYSLVLDAYRLPKGNREELRARARAIHEALEGAAAVPSSVGHAANRLLRQCEETAEIAPPFAASDLAVAVHLAWAALQGAVENVRANRRALRDLSARTRLEEDAEALLVEGRRAYEDAIRATSALTNR